MNLKMNRIFGVQSITFLVVVALHVGLLTWLMQRASATRLTQVSSPIMVSLLVREQQASSLLSAAQNTTSKKFVPALTADSLAVVSEQAKNLEDKHVPTQAETTQLPQESQMAARFDADYLRNPAPAYPLLSSRLREEGTVYLRVQVHAEGYAMRVEIKSSSGYTRLDQAGMAAVQQWRFVPARQGEQAVESWVIVPVNFYLKR